MMGALHTRFYGYLYVVMSIRCRDKVKYFEVSLFIFCSLGEGRGVLAHCSGLQHRHNKQFTRTQCHGG